MNTAPLTGRPRSTRPTWLIAVLGCFGGCAVLILILLALGGLGIRALMAPKTPPPAGYVGQWQGADQTTLAIGADGVAAYRYKHGMTTGYLSGGRIRVDEAHKTLSIRLAGLGQTWHINAEPHMTGNTMEMKLNGIVFQRTEPTSSGMLSNQGETSSSGSE